MGGEAVRKRKGHGESNRYIKRGTLQGKRHWRRVVGPDKDRRACQDQKPRKIFSARSAGRLARNTPTIAPHATHRPRFRSPHLGHGTTPQGNLNRFRPINSPQSEYSLLRCWQVYCCKTRQVRVRAEAVRNEIARWQSFAGCFEGVMKRGGSKRARSAEEGTKLARIDREREEEDETENSASASPCYIHIAPIKFERALNAVAIKGNAVCDTVLTRRCQTWNFADKRHNARPVR